MPVQRVLHGFTAVAELKPIVCRLLDISVGGSSPRLQAVAELKRYAVSRSPLAPRVLHGFTAVAELKQLGPSMLA